MQRVPSINHPGLLHLTARPRAGLDRLLKPLRLASLIQETFKNLCKTSDNSLLLLLATLAQTKP